MIIVIMLWGMGISTHHKLYAQNIKEKESYADQLLYNKSYHKASQLYKHLVQLDSNNIDLWYKYAQSLLLQHNYKNTLSTYSSLKRRAGKLKPIAFFNIARSAQNIYHYQEAITNYTIYISIGLSEALRKQSEQYIKECKFIINHQNDSAKYSIKHLPPPINTPYSEFNPVAISNNELVFSRYEALFDDSIETVFNKSYISDLYLSKQTQRGWQKPTLFAPELSSNKFFTANINFSKNQRIIYFTRCENNEGSIGNCAIYRAERKNRKWRKIKKLGDAINKEGYSSTQAFLVEDKDYSILYFSSNMPNGFGGMDLWYAIIKNGKILQVSNLGSIINTSGNEVSPFYDTKQGLLYFSSDHHKGYGGYDIYKSAGNLSQWNKVSNLGFPINSASNDLYYSHVQEGEIIYFSSNRVGSYYHNSIKNCCGDIYIGILDDENNKTKQRLLIKTTDSIGKRIRKLLPLTLYFENDMPNPKTTKTTTNANYKDLLSQYIQARERYKAGYSKGLSGIEAQKAKAAIDSFFIEKVAQGFSNLKLFTTLLRQELETGKQVNIQIRGYASPLNTATYNLALSKRRISSLINYIKTYNNGYFIPYLNKGLLKIYEDPLGDSQFTERERTLPNDKRNTVYSTEAALQRKIQIIKYSNDTSFRTEAAYPKLQWLQKSINLGTIKKGKKASTIIHYQNIGTTELKIKGAQSSCKCIQIQLEETVLQSNRKGKLYLLLRSRDLKPGHYTVKIKLTTNESGNYSSTEVQFQIR